jgi:NAD(P)-dependent dehydrogenase (short-subunit alcohol dehydrogenase family)
MEHFGGRIAVVTGGGTGMGRELALQLATEGCHVAMCDVSADDMAETGKLCAEAAPEGTRVTTFLADVSDEAAVLAFRDAVAAEHDTDCIHLLFNNAGIGGGGSLLGTTREEWDHTFGVDWGGVYHGTRAFLGLLLAADEGHVVNTSSVNGFYAALGPNGPHTAYSAAKFAVKGFTEALITDFRLNAPHLHAHVVMPGHIGTSIILNSMKIHQGTGVTGEGGEAGGGEGGEAGGEAGGQRRRAMLQTMGFPVDTATDDELDAAMTLIGEGFRDMAPTTAAQAATIILDGVRANRWRILVGDDAHRLDEAVRADPESAYTPEFWPALQAEGHFSGAG